MGSLALTRFELNQGGHYVRRDVCSRASSETDPSIGLQVFSGFGFAKENDYLFMSTACTSSADLRRDWAEGPPSWPNLGRGMEGDGLC
jgi:hypothetical protein